MIQAIVFDYGNVISEPQDTGCYGRMGALSGLSEEFFRKSFWKYRPDFDRGTLRGVEMYKRVLTDDGFAGSEAEITELAGRLLDEDVLSWRRVSAPVTEWGLSLQKQGYRLGILSNMPFDFLERYEPVIELFAKADIAVFSCNVRQIKPEPAIYRTLISQCACKPEEIVFFDDIQANVDGAIQAGIKAYLWTGLEQARRDWQSALQ